MDNKNFFEDSSDLNEKSKKQMKNFVDYIKTINSELAESLKTNLFIRRMRSKLHDINQQNSLNMFFDKNEKESINKLFVTLDSKFIEEINKWKNNFPSTFEDFKKSKKEKIHDLKRMFDLYERTILKDNYYMIRNSYVKDQYQLLYFQMIKLIEEDLYIIENDCFSSWMKDLTISFKEKFHKIEQEITNYYKMQNNSIEIRRMNILDRILYFFQNFFTPFFIIAESLSLWSREMCFDDVVGSFYQSIKQELDEIIKLSKDKFKEFTKNLKDHLIKLKETLNKITIFHQILNNYERINMESIKETPRELIKKALKDLEEEDKIKDIFEKVIDYQK